MNSVPRIHANGARRYVENTTDGIEAMHNRTRYLAQSILTVDGETGPLLPLERAEDVVAWHQRHLDQQARQRTGWGYRAHIPAHLRERMIFTSGHANPLRLDAQDRRYQVVATA